MKYPFIEFHIHHLWDSQLGEIRVCERVNPLSDMYNEKFNPWSEDDVCKRLEMADKSSQISLKIAKDAASVCQEM